MLKSSGTQLTNGVAAGRSEHGPNVQSATTTTRWNTVAPAWREKTYLCVYDSAQVLKVVMAHNMETGATCFPKHLPVDDVVNKAMKQHMPIVHPSA
jgi:hypothetical protein